MSKILPSLQLFTIRDQTKSDYVNAVRQVAAMGYQGVELAGFGNLASAVEVKKALDDAGLKIVGDHVGLETFEKDAGRVFENAAVFGNKLIIVPWIAESLRKSADDWRKIAGSLNKWGQECQKRGLQLAYHNHAFEFEKFDGVSGMDILWGAADAGLVKSELDVYWVKYGGEEPLAYIDKLGARIASLHLKDMTAGPERKFAPVGTGILDFKKIIEAGQKYGVKNYIVEQDNTYELQSLEAAKVSLGNLKKIRMA